MCKLINLYFATLLSANWLIPGRIAGIMAASILINMATILVFIGVENYWFGLAFLFSLIFLIILEYIFTDKYIAKLHRLNQTTPHSTIKVRQTVVIIYEILTFASLVLLYFYVKAA